MNTRVIKNGDNLDDLKLIEYQTSMGACYKIKGYIVDDDEKNLYVKKHRSSTIEKIQKRFLKKISNCELITFKNLRMDAIKENGFYDKLKADAMDNFTTNNFLDLFKDTTRKKRKKEYSKEYNNRPEVKVRRKEYNKGYYNNTEVKVRRKEYNNRSEVKARMKKYLKEYYNNPEVKAKRKKYYKRYYEKSKKESIKNNNNDKK